MPIPVIIVSGFLGGGKTTFLRHLLPLCGRAHIRPVLVVNEAGTVDVDGQLLADLGAEQISLLGGCICCTMQGELARNVQALVERDAGDLLIIECSGFSAPKDVVAALAVPELRGKIAITHTICLIDCARFHRARTIVQLVSEQVAAADILIMNKVDKIADEARQALESSIDELRHPQASVFWTSYGEIGHDAVLKIITDPAPQTCACGHGQCAHDHHHAHALPASFTTVTLALPDRLDRHALTAMISSLPDTVIRAKGFLHLAGEGWQVLQRVFEQTTIIPADSIPTTPPFLVCIGQQLDGEALQRLVDMATAN